MILITSKLENNNIKLIIKIIHKPVYFHPNYSPNGMLLD